MPTSIRALEEGPSSLDFSKGTQTILNWTGKEVSHVPLVWGTFTLPRAGASPPTRSPSNTSLPYMLSFPLKPLLPPLSPEVVLAHQVTGPHVLLCLENLHSVHYGLGLSATCYRRRRGADIHSTNKDSGTRPVLGAGDTQVNRTKTCPVVLASWRKK